MEILILLLTFFVAYVVYLYFKSNILPKLKGLYGEYIVATKLKRLNKKEYLVINDILLKSGNSTTQIDHLVICQSGIFVIETKKYKGWIHGHQKSEYWTQTIYNYRRKIRNPIKQNWAHIFALKKLLSEFQHIKYFPIVVFTGEAELKNIISNIPVLYENEVLKTIKHANDHQILSLNEIKLISEKLEKFRLRDKKEIKKHIRTIKENIWNRRKKERMKICPKCGNDLIKRKGKYGKFYGCSNYPQCKFTLRV